MSIDDNAALLNAQAAVASLSSFLSIPVESERDRAGVIQAFEFTFETIWKLLKRIAEREACPLNHRDVRWSRATAWA